MSAPPSRGPEGTRSHASDDEMRLVGAMVGIVTNITDPKGQGRIMVRFPWLDDEVQSHWARLAQPYAGNGRGTFILPEMGDEVACVFVGGDPAHCCVLGGLWNGTDVVPPPGNPDGQNNHKIWRTRNSHQVIFDDTEGAEKITLIDGKNERHLVIDVAADTITLTAQPGDITFSAPKESITIECVDLEIDVKGNSSWDVGTNLSDSSKDRTETITGPDSVSAKTSWSVNGPSTSVSATSSSVSAKQSSVSVGGSLTMTNSQGRSIKSETVQRESAPETATVGQMKVEAKGTVAMVVNGPITVNSGSQMYTATDARFVGPMVTVLGGMANFEAGTALNAKAGLVTLC